LVVLLGSVLAPMANRQRTVARSFEAETKSHAEAQAVFEQALAGTATYWLQPRNFSLRRAIVPQADASIFGPGFETRRFVSALMLAGAAVQLIRFPSIRSDILRSDKSLRRSLQAIVKPASA
jgi:hypothetical protein